MRKSVSWTYVSSNLDIEVCEISRRSVGRRDCDLATRCWGQGVISGTHKKPRRVAGLFKITI